MDHAGQTTTPSLSVTIRAAVLNCLAQLIDAETPKAQIWLWWLRDAIAPSFDPVTDDDLLEALITLDDRGDISLFDDSDGQTWFRLNPPPAAASSPQTGDLRHLAWPPVPSRPSPQNGPQCVRFEPSEDAQTAAKYAGEYTGNEDERTRGARGLRERESVRARERASAGVTAAAVPPSQFCERHRPTGPGFDENGDYIECRACGDHRSVREDWLIINGYRKPRK